VDECKPLRNGVEAVTPAMGEIVDAIAGRGLHSSPFQLNLSRF